MSREKHTGLDPAASAKADVIPAAHAIPIPPLPPVEIPLPPVHPPAGYRGDNAELVRMLTALLQQVRDQAAQIVLAPPPVGPEAVKAIASYRLIRAALQFPEREERRTFPTNERTPPRAV